MPKHRIVGSIRCEGCGLVNFAGAEACRRCQFALDIAPVHPLMERSGPSLMVRVTSVIGVSLVVLGGWWVSLFATSEPLGPTERDVVYRAVEVLRHRGFPREVFAVRHLARLRATDNWWNLYNGHDQAYVSTNFPFEVVTVYRWFFEVPRDDVERAVILLHEAQHLLGANEETALRTVWRDKARLGWTAEAYGDSQVWKNTREWTLAAAPDLFACAGSSKRCD